MTETIRREKRKKKTMKFGDDFGARPNPMLINPEREPDTTGVRTIIDLRVQETSDGQVKVTGIPQSIDVFCQVMMDANRAAMKHFVSQAVKDAAAGPASDIVLARPGIVNPGNGQVM